ncbi:MAG: hypothetical protein COA32_15875 [Fluviicola sp.]|nr:MAG: hypothetical protein COA32_15875 [Fluviicola sp.]
MYTLQQTALHKLLGLFVLLLGLPVFINAQTYESEKAFRDQQDSIFGILLANPDLAKEKIDDLIAQEDQMSDTTKGLNYSLNGIYYNVTGNNDKSIENFHIAIDLLKDHPYRLVKVRTNLGTALRNSRQFEASIDEFEKLLEYYKKEDDSARIAKMYGEIAANYNMTLENDKAVNYLTKAISILSRHDTGVQSDLGVMQQRLANTYFKQSRFEFANKLYRKSMKAFKASNQLNNYYLTLINLAESYNHLEEHDTALITINESIKGLETFKNKNLLAISNGVKASILVELNQNEKAAKFYSIAYNYALESNSDRFVQIARDYIISLVKLEKFDRANLVYEETMPYLENSNIEYQYSFLLEAARYFSNVDDFEKAFELSEQSHTLKDSSYYTNKQELVDELQTRYRVHEKERANTQLKLDVLKKEKNISILTLSILIAVFIILFIVIIWRSRINYKNKVLALEKGNNADLTSKLEVEKENSELKQKLIEQQKSELLGYSMEVSNMNEKIESLIKKFDNSDISTSLSGELKSLITVNKSWDSFIERFKEVDPDFIPRLSKKHPNLTQKDLEFCSLVRINISYKDIGNFLQISHESVFKKKYRISKKMELGQETDFQSYIIQF